jgi:hypothetical protein
MQDLAPASFPRHLAVTQLLFGYGFPPPGPPEDFHLPVTSRFAFAPRLTAPTLALRVMPDGQNKKPM